MPTRCLRIRLREGCGPDAEAWAGELNSRADEVRETLVAEGVALEAVFLDRRADGDDLIYVMNAPDFDRVTAVARESTAAVDAFHRAFKERCWETRDLLHPLIDFVVDMPAASPPGDDDVPS